MEENKEKVSFVIFTLKGTVYRDPMWVILVLWATIISILGGYTHGTPKTSTMAGDSLGLIF
jgi:hypothetical protein